MALPPNEPLAPQSAFEKPEKRRTIADWERNPMIGSFTTSSAPEKLLTEEEKMWEAFRREEMSAGKVVGIFLDLVNTFAKATIGQAFPGYSLPDLEGDGNTGDSVYVYESPREYAEHKGFTYGKLGVDF